MAVTDRNIVITPNRTAVGKVQPKIVFTGADSSIGDSSAITPVSYTHLTLPTR